MGITKYDTVGEERREREEGGEGINNTTADPPTDDATLLILLHIKFDAAMHTHVFISTKSRPYYYGRKNEFMMGAQ